MAYDYYMNSRDPLVVTLDTPETLKHEYDRNHRYMGHQSTNRRPRNAIDAGAAKIQGLVTPGRSKTLNYD